ncbi:hypothetical protein MMC20_004844 [Loxospora ochrophaea]|nr:hypothetical protein [Loxospora ochrophaea]
MSTILRTLRNLRKIGFKEYGHQMQNMGDTKAGTYIATDRFGNKYYENLEQELPLRTRWVDYKEQEYDPSVPPVPTLLARHEVKSQRSYFANASKSTN